MEKFEVVYQGGESRYNPGKAVDFMSAEIPGVGELYAEIPADPEDEAATYEELKAEIIEQAEAAGVDPAALSFWYD